jgi:hypothetical protein
MYRCETTSLAGFVQQLATSYLTHGYYFYVTGRVPDGKDPRAVDAKLIARYAIGVSKWAAARRKRAGGANVQYLRLGRFFVLLATHGTHHFFEDEGARIQDARHVSLKVAGYALSVRHGHVRVSIEREEYRQIKAYFLDRATHRSAAVVAGELGALPFEPYAPVRSQLLCIWRAVNRARGEAGFEAVPKTCLRFKRRLVRPFESACVARVEEAA